MAVADVSNGRCVPFFSLSISLFALVLVWMSPLMERVPAAPGLYVGPEVSGFDEFRWRVSGSMLNRKFLDLMSPDGWRV